MKEYDVTMGENIVGRAWIEKQGLYLLIQCQCHFAGDEMRRLKVSCGQNEVDLGILVPERDCFVLKCRIPVKRLGKGDCRFLIMRKNRELDGKFIAVYPEEPFAYISRLKQAHMARQDDRIGVILPE